MAIHKRVKDPHKHAPAGATMDVTVPSFSYPPSDKLAQLIVDAWKNVPFPTPTSPGLKDLLLDRDAKGDPTNTALKAARDRLKLADFDLKSAVVISEEEHDADYYTSDPDEVVFVLPKESRPDMGGANLLNTAKLLMACTPNGI